MVFNRIWVSDCSVCKESNFVSYIMVKTSWWDGVHFVLDQYAKLYFISLTNQNNSQKVDMSSTDTLFWYRANQSLLLLLSVACLMATHVQWSGKRKWLWAIAAPSSQHSMDHFSVVFVKTKIFYGPFNFCMGHLHRITKLYVSNVPWPLPFPITASCVTFRDSGSEDVEIFSFTCVTIKLHQATYLSCCSYTCVTIKSSSSTIVMYTCTFFWL